MSFTLGRTRGLSSWKPLKIFSLRIRSPRSTHRSVREKRSLRLFVAILVGKSTPNINFSRSRRSSSFFSLCFLTSSGLYFFSNSSVE